MIFLTTTAVEIDEELLNRCLVLTVDEDREQTRAIHRLQRERQTLEGLLADHERERMLARPPERPAAAAPAAGRQPLRPRAHLPRHPHADPARSHEVPDADPRDRAAAPVPAPDADDGAARRDARLHRGDARRHRAGEPPRARGARPLARRAAAADPPAARAPRRDGARGLRAARRSTAATSASAAATSARRPAGATRSSRCISHRLVELEYLLVHRGGRGQSFVYELLYGGEGQDGARVRDGAGRSRAIGSEYDGRGRGLSPTGRGRRPRSRGQVGPKSGRSRGVVGMPRAPPTPCSDKGFGDSAAESPENARLRARRRGFAVVVVPGHASARPGRKRRLPPPIDASDPRGFPVLIAEFLEHLRMRELLAAHGRELPRLPGLLHRLGDRARHHAARRGHQARPRALPALALPLPQQKNGRPLCFRTQHVRLTPVRTFFRWLAKENHILSNPASELELPKLEKRLPKHVLSVSEVERVLTPSISRTRSASRDRAILETLYSTGMRRMELIHLQLYDLDTERGTVHRPPGQGEEGSHGADRRAGDPVDREVPRRGAAGARRRARPRHDLPHQLRRAVHAAGASRSSSAGYVRGRASARAAPATSSATRWPR